MMVLPVLRSCVTSSWVEARSALVRTTAAARRAAVVSDARMRGRTKHGMAMLLDRSKV
jgi:hypothetical protein